MDHTATYCHFSIITSEQIDLYLYFFFFLLLRLTKICNEEISSSPYKQWNCQSCAKGWFYFGLFRGVCLSSRVYMFAWTHKAVWTSKDEFCWCRDHIMLFDPPDPIMPCYCWKVRRHCWVSSPWTAHLRWCVSSKPAQLWKTCSSSHRMLTWPYFRCRTVTLPASQHQMPFSEFKRHLKHLKFSFIITEINL